MKKTMKSFIIILVVILGVCIIFFACSSPFAVTPAATALTPTAEPSKTPEPSPTPDLRFSELIPDQLQKCQQNNRLRLDHFAEDFAKLREMEKKIVIDNSKIGDYAIRIMKIDPLKDKLPSAIVFGSGVFGNKYPGILQNPLVSCSYLETADGYGMYVFGLIMKHTYTKGSVGVAGIIHFAVDPEATKALGPYIYDGYNSETDIETNYSKMVTGQYNQYNLYPVIGDGAADKNGVYKNLLQLYGGDANYDPMMNKLTDNRWFSDEEARELMDHFGDKILAAVGFGILPY